MVASVLSGVTHSAHATKETRVGASELTTRSQPQDSGAALETFTCYRLRGAEPSTRSCSYTSINQRSCVCCGRETEIPAEHGCSFFAQAAHLYDRSSGAGGQRGLCDSGDERNRELPDPKRLFLFRGQPPAQGGFVARLRHVSAGPLRGWFDGGGHKMEA